MTTGRFVDVDQLLDEVVTLPSMPDTLLRLTDLLDDPNCSLSEVARTIATDPSIALKTLRLVNSAYYGLGQEVKTVEHAVVLLGAKVIRNLALTATVFTTFQSGASRYLEHSVAVGAAMRVLAEIGPLRGLLASSEEAFIYGLLHDIGKVILREHLPAEVDEVEFLVREKRMPWHIAEREVIGVDHASIGGRLAQKWRLSHSIAFAISFHHDPEVCPAEHRLMAATLNVADHISASAGFPCYDHPVLDLSSVAWEISGLNGNQVTPVLDQFCAAVPGINELVKLAA